VKIKIEKLGETPTMNVSETCSNCESSTKSRRRDFSEQAWSVLILWNEVAGTAVQQPICDDCYGEMREVLIDRADEIDAALSQPKSKPLSKRKKQSTRKAG
jgi:hypothetical protein